MDVTDSTTKGRNKGVVWYMRQPLDMGEPLREKGHTFFGTNVSQAVSSEMLVMWSVTRERTLMVDAWQISLLL